MLARQLVDLYMRIAKKGQFKIFDASAYKAGIVVAQFNKDITERMLTSALKELKKYKIKRNNIIVCRVPGSVEIPVALQALAKTEKYDCLIAIGCVIRGETEHFTYVCNMAVDGIMEVMLDFDLPVGFGILTVENYEQAVARISAGAQAAEAAVQTARLVQRLLRGARKDD